LTPTSTARDAEKDAKAKWNAALNCVEGRSSRGAMNVTTPRLCLLSTPAPSRASSVRMPAILGLFACALETRPHVDRCRAGFDTRRARPGRRVLLAWTVSGFKPTSDEDGNRFDLQGPRLNERFLAKGPTLVPSRSQSAKNAAKLSLAVICAALGRIDASPSQSPRASQDLLRAAAGGSEQAFTTGALGRLYLMALLINRADA